MKPLIGLIPLVDDERESLWMLPGYMDGIRTSGGLPIMLPLTDHPAEILQLLGTCNGFLFTGGHDVSPEIYGETRRKECGICSPQRDRMELLLLEYAMKKNKPILGICRGIQLINAALGGTLWQDLPTEHPSKTQHHQHPPYDKPIHEVNLCPNTPLADLLGRSSLSVNSYHHQAIRDLAHALRPMAIAPDGLIEAIWHPETTFLWAVQWHPEFAYKTDEASQAIFKAFVRACNPGV
ncbi:MAG: gamma-glutamyl-gamma-aminobutyrate hydrolase family protein [Clostridia bacterium]|nr:gamma-glutamyl-gamma-aminobutyrate hydrolase family protein [Clostridia bacterium]